MDRKAKSEGPIAKIVIGAVVALLVGGSSPWWWSKLPFNRRAPQIVPSQSDRSTNRPAEAPTPEPSRESQHGSIDHSPGASLNQYIIVNPATSRVGTPSGGDFRPSIPTKPRGDNDSLAAGEQRQTPSAPRAPPASPLDASKARLSSVPAQRDTYAGAIEHASLNIENYFTLSDKTVLVLDFIGQTDDTSSLGRLMAEGISDKLTNIARGFKVRDRHDVAEAVGVNNLNISVLRDPEKKKLLKERFGVHAIIDGALFSLDGEDQLRLRVVDLASGSVLITSEEHLANRATKQE